MAAVNPENDIIQLALSPEELNLQQEQGVKYMQDSDFRYLRDQPKLFKNIDALFRRCNRENIIKTKIDNYDPDESGEIFLPPNTLPALMFVSSFQGSEWYKGRWGGVVEMNTIRLKGTIMILDSPSHIPIFDNIMYSIYKSAPENDHIFGYIQSMWNGTIFTKNDCIHLHLLFRLLCGMVPSYTRENIIGSYDDDVLENLRLTLHTFIDSVISDKALARPIRSNGNYDANTLANKHSYITHRNLNVEFKFLISDRPDIPTRVTGLICERYMTFLCNKLFNKSSDPLIKDMNLVGIITSNNPSLLSKQPANIYYDPCELLTLKNNPILYRSKIPTIRKYNEEPPRKKRAFGGKKTCKHRKPYKKIKKHKSRKHYILFSHK